MMTSFQAWRLAETSGRLGQRAGSGAKRRLQGLLLAIACGLARGVLGNDPPAYQENVRPLLIEYCGPCHGAEVTEAELDLTAFADLEQARSAVPVWQKVAEMLDSGQMPPPEAEQPSDTERDVLQRWLVPFLREEATRTAGDPGPVVLRRLSHAEYTYSVRNLTGLAELHPTREFPIDGAAGEGFTNAGSGLVMSPSLLQKYLQAGKETAAHAVLLPDGIRFSPGTTRRDWTEEILAEIRGLYARYCDAEGATQVNLQGIVFDTNGGGRLPIEPYLRALLAEREALTDGRTTIADIAGRDPLSAKYLASLWQQFTTADEPKAIGLMPRLRASFRTAQAKDAPELAAEIAKWQTVLWRFSSVGHIGKLGGPKAWMEPASPLTAHQELRLAVPAPVADQSGAAQDVLMYLVAGDAGDGHRDDELVWERPRLVRPGRPDVLIRDVRGWLVAARLAGFAPWRARRHDDPHPGFNPDLRDRDHLRPVIGSANVYVATPSVVTVHIPAELAVGAELVTAGHLHPQAGPDASVQIQLLTARPESPDGLRTPTAEETRATGPWTSNNQVFTLAGPIVVADGSAARQRFEADFDEFRLWFPPALCYAKIVPVDEVVTLTLYYREDETLRRLMLSDEESARLDRLWAELHFVSHDALSLVDAFEQLWQYATQDADPSVFEPLRQPILDRAEAFRRELIEAEPAHLEAVVQWASQAHRRPLSIAEADRMRELYHSLRRQEMDHDSAIRLLVARVLVAPEFLYRAERGLEAAPVVRRDTLTWRAITDWELATRLSYFLGSSVPDEELREAASSGRLHIVDVLADQARRMQRDPRVRRLATEFACQWLHVYQFDEHDEKSPAAFPQFSELRGPMHEETVRFFTDWFQRDGSILELLDADHTFVNGTLAEHYQIADVEGPEWRRVDGLKQHGRGGILGLAATLAKQSGASRTSPVLRGAWVCEALLGEKLPKPPPGVPQLPDVVPAGLTERQMAERHVADVSCAKCHAKIDPYGFALEGFDAIGTSRDVSKATEAENSQPIDSTARLPDGTRIAGLAGLREYLLTTRRDDFVRQFCRKLLGYALGRSVQLSDEPLLEAMQQSLAANDFRVGVAIRAIVESPQFRHVRVEAEQVADSTDAIPESVP